MATSGLKSMRKAIAVLLEFLKVIILCTLQAGYGALVAYLLLGFTPYHLEYKTVFIGFVGVRFLLLRNDDKTLEEDMLLHIFFTTVVLVIWALLKVVL